MQLTINLPERSEQILFNRTRWQQVISDRSLADLPFKIETNYSGQLIMTPPPSGEHSRRQTQIALLLSKLLGGQPLTECPVSTIDGVRAADVAWYSDDRFAGVRGQTAFERAPEICVEVISPSNTASEMQHKRSLYFEAGAEEVWHCTDDGMEFYLKSAPNSPEASSPRCRDFPVQV